MRNITLLTVNVLLCVIPLIANTTPSKELLFVPEDEKSVILNVSDLNLETVSIIDRDGVELFVDVIEENKRKIKYNLNSLPNGQYTIRLNGESFAEFYQATISPTAVNIKKTESYYRPIININNNKLIVNVSEALQDDISISILDASGEVIYTFKEGLNGPYQKSFDLKALTNGNYIVQISTDYFSEIVQLNV